MNYHQSTNGSRLSVKILFWILGAFFTVLLSVVGFLLTSSAATLADTTRLTTKHETQIGTLQVQLDRMDNKLDQILMQR